jgi:prepilin-type N-terminal cleavage/methylation domain-containing protein
MFQDSSNKKRGFTLIEIMFSIMFFAIISLSLSLPFGNSISLTVDSRNINSANNLARSYLKDMEAKWRIQSVFDTGELIPVDTSYTNNGKYLTTVTSQSISEDSAGVVVVRRINVKFQDKKGHYLADIYYDFNRPGNI